MKDKVLIVGGILLSLGMTKAVVSADNSTNYSSNGAVQFVENRDPTDPVDPENPGKPTHPIDPTDPNGPQPGTSGPLSIDFASSIDFGKNKISNKDERYYANPQHLIFHDGSEKDVPNYLQVTDNRGTNAGWVLKVCQESQLRNNLTKHKELTGAEITLSKFRVVSNQQKLDVEKPSVHNIVLTPGYSSNVMTASKGKGGGTWLDVFGSLNKITIANKKELKNSDVSLFVPGSTPKDAVRYMSKLNWTLSEVPSN